MARNRGRAAAAIEVDETPVKASDGLTPVRTTFNPREVIRVGAAELLDLERQGLIHSRGDADEIPDDEAGEVTHGNGVVESGVITDQADIPATDDEDESEGQE